jgi:hypothetical protein
MTAFEIRNTLAKLAIVAWIAGLVALSFFIAKHSVAFDPDAFFGTTDANRLPADGIKEIRVLILMLSVSIIGGVSFIIKDFYRSVKYANLYDRAYDDFRSGNITKEGFQKLATVEIYSGRFNYTWIYWFLIQPILSSALGIIAFFIARSGLGVITGSTAEPDISIRSLYLYAVFTFLAGFSSHKFIAWLDRLADKIFSTTLPDEKAKEQKESVENAAATDREALREEISSEDKNGDGIPDNAVMDIKKPASKKKKAAPAMAAAPAPTATATATEPAMKAVR